MAMTTSSSNPAPFAQIDAQIAQMLLSLALERGGDYADLYFEYRVGADIVLEEEKIKSLGRGITMGLGVRVLRGEATGYAYSEDLSFERMAQAARTAGQIAAGGGAPAPVGIAAVQVPNFYPVAAPSIAEAPTGKLALLTRADRAARAADPRIVKCEVSLGEEQREILVVTSDGKLIRDTQPLLRFSVRAVAEAGPKRQS